MAAGDDSFVIADWTDLMDMKKITERSSNHYLYHNGKPLVAVWGVGFKDREYGYEEAGRIIDFLKKKGCSVMLGVPNKWRTFEGSADNNPKLHELIKKVDIVHPWFVGSYNNDTFSKYQSVIKEDIAWCRQYGILYIPTVFPGFSWYNMKSGESPLNHIPRLKGDFFWNQVYFDIYSGAKCLYVAMFDEIDEGTAIFKCANTVPVGASPFVTYEGVPPDRVWTLYSLKGMTPFI